MSLGQGKSDENQEGYIGLKMVVNFQVEDKKASYN